ncbi:MAG: hypothetical protein LAT58_09365, partial [Opitutales bacterium]|nr:hypothetical protein [Opitutales bacterium]
MKKTLLYLVPAIAGFALVLIWSQRSEQISNEVVSPDQEPVFASSEEVERGPSPSSEQEVGGEDVPSEADEERAQGIHELRPIEEYPILTWADRIDMEGQPAPRIQRGRHERRVFDTHVDREVSRDNPEAIRPFGRAIAARRDSPIAHDHYAKSAVEVGISHRLFEQASQGDRHRMVVPLTEETEVTMDLEKIVDRGEHTFSFIGRVEEHEDSMAHLVYNEGTVSGTVALYGNDTWDSQHFEFLAMEDGLVAVRELNAETVVQNGCGCCAGSGGHGAEDPFFDTTESEETAYESAEPMGEVDHVVDITVGYGRQARIAAGGVAAIEGQIIAAVDRMNTSFANSGVSNTKLVLLGMMEDPDYEFPGWDPDRMSAELSRLGFHSSDGHLNAIYDFSEELGTDLRSFIIREPKDWGGFANQPGRNSVVARTAVNTTSLLFVHEVGHNFGLSHSWGDSTFAQDTDTSAHNYGWRHRSGNTRRRTVMSYDHNWQAVMHFSNPDVINPTLGVPTGAVNGYDARNDNTTDSRYVEGGLVGSLGAGFDGSNPSLGARNAHALNANSSTTANYGTRASLGVTRPASGEVAAFGEPYLIEWVGGSYHDDLEIELLKAGTPVQTLGSDLTNGERVFAWTPEGLSQGDDYQLRLTLNEGEEVAVSGSFTIESDFPVVVDTFVAPLGIAEPGLSEVSVTFNRSMDTDSFSPGTDVTRFVGPEGEDLRSTFTDFTWSEDDTVLTFSFAALEDPGFYRIDFGPEILDLRGFSMDQNGNDVPGEIDDGFGFTFRVAELAEGGTVALIDSNFETNPGFTLEGGWAIGSPNQSGVGGPGSAYSGNNVMGTYLNGNYPANISIYATSPSFNMNGASNITLSFRRWLGLHRDTSGPAHSRRQDRAAVQYSVNGGNWIGIWNHNNGVFDDGGWTALQTIQLPEAAEGAADVRFRFWLVTESDESYGWNIDDLSFTADFEETFATPPAPKVVGHMPAGAVLAAPEAVWIDFDQPMNTGSFSLSDLSGISGADPTFAVTGYAWTANNRLRLDLTGVNEDGTYTLTLGTGVQSVS